jgi:glycolate oxidase iron-sulfur subunit
VNLRTPERFLDDQKSLACVHCGLCLSACPTYLETGNENDSPRGRIHLMRAIQDDRLPLADAAVKHLDLCLGCRACEAACPSGVQYGELLEHTREHVERHHHRSVFQTLLRRILIEKVLPVPWRMRIALQPALWLKRAGVGHLLPRALREALELVPDDAGAVQLPSLSPAISQEKRGRVGFISGCVMSVMFGRTNENSVRLLNQSGYDVLTPAAQVCCGALFAHAGNLDRARDCARRNIATFERLKLDAVVINAAGCGSTLKEYDQLLAGDPDWAERGRQFSAKVKDLTEFLAGMEPLSSLNPQLSTFPAKVTCHDACHLVHAQRITKAPRELIKSVAGEGFVELGESDVCCGSAGSYNLTEPEMAERLQRRKVQHILASGADTVVTTNPGCILQIRSGLAKAGASHIRVLHVADYLECASSEKQPLR